jgi:hypothetical protein
MLFMERNLYSDMESSMEFPQKIKMYRAVKFKIHRSSIPTEMK